VIRSGEDIPANVPSNTEDIDDIQECEQFETRERFLHYCQEKQYQFDQLRRAKHSSMMILYQLLYPDTLTEKQRKEYQQKLSAKLQLLLHASQCVSCEVENCKKMKVRDAHYVYDNLILFFCFSIVVDIFGPRNNSR
jgi:E1A/CREB-binding protein